MDINTNEAVAEIVRRFDAEGEYGFISAEDINGLVRGLIAIDMEYMDSLGEDGVYDEEFIFEKLHSCAKEICPQHSAYMMRFAEDYMDFMEEYLVSIDAIEWE